MVALGTSDKWVDGVGKWIPYGSRYQAYYQ